MPASVTFNADDTEVDINFTATHGHHTDHHHRPGRGVQRDGESVKLTFGNTLPAGVSVLHRSCTDQPSPSTPASVTFNADDTEVDINFTATQDQDNDDGESVKLTFGNTLPTGVSAGTTDEAVVTITDDDVPSVEVSFEQGEAELPERTVTIPLTATRPAPTTPACPPASPSTQMTPRWTSTSPPPKTRTTTMGRA